jgi:HK97 gp10 family phage protein
MSDTVTAKLVGVEDLLSNIKKLAIASPTAVMKGVLRVAMKVERDAKGGVPVDTGRLRASLSTNWTGSGKASGDVDTKAKAGDGIGQPPERPDTFTAVTGTNVEYAAKVEFDEKATHEVGGPHYLYSAYFRNEDNVQKEIASELGKEMAKTFKKK